MIKYVDTLADIGPERLAGFFVGWIDPPAPETHLKILQESDFIVLAIDEETKKVIGFISAISDKVLSAYIPLLEVLPAYQKKGIGRELVRQMLLKLERLYMVDLVCDAPLEQFYACFNMIAGRAMMIRNYERQSGR